MVYRLVLAYQGASFAGWQRQSNAVAVQEVVEVALEKLLGRSVRIVGASRTDAGVHARGQVAHLELPQAFSVDGLVCGTNHHLPSEIRVLAADRMATGFHARKSAVAKEYRYRVSRARVPSPLDAPFVWHSGQDLSLGALASATRALPGRHDFTAFAKQGGAHRQPFRRVLAAQWLRRGDELHLRIVGDGFLRGMIRALVGTLIDVGRGRLSVDQFSGLLEGGSRSDAGPSAPARGLCLESVFYPSRWQPSTGGSLHTPVAIPQARDQEGL